MLNDVASTKAPRRSRIRNAVAVVALAGGTLFAVLMWRTEIPSAPVTILPVNYVRPTSTRDKFLQRFGPEHRWVRRAESAFFGQRKLTMISSEILQFNGTNAEPFLAALKLGPPVYTDETLNVWFLRNSGLAQVSGELARMTNVQALGRPRVQTSDDATGSMFIGGLATVDGKPVEVGVSCAFTPAASERSTSSWLLSNTRLRRANRSLMIWVLLAFSRHP